MCIFLIISPLDKKAGILAPSDVEKHSGLIAEVYGRGAISLSPHGECACAFASGNVPTEIDWKVQADFQEKIVKAVEIAARCMKRFKMTATWMGDPPVEERAVTLKELIRKIKNEPIGGKAFIVRRR